jgi:hypothetical protein
MKSGLVCALIVALSVVPGVSSASRSAASIRTAPAWVWYYSAPTQCVVNHEGGVSSVSPGGKYHGTFQMDYSFETSTPYGRHAEARWGRASNWPLSVQVHHAHEVWVRDGWGHWPTYYNYCS